jgi:hypothetical protein
MVLPRMSDTSVTSHIQDLQNSGQPVVQQLRPSRRASVVISQVHCYGIIDYNWSTCSQIINIYTIVRLITSEQVKV